MTGIIVFGLGSGCRHLPVALLSDEGAYFGGEPTSFAVDARVFEQALGKSSPLKPILRRVAGMIRDGRPAEACNSIGYLEGGSDALLARLHLIQEARRRIDLQTFIWVNDESGRLLTEALVAAAKRGVQVRVLVDYFGMAKDASALASFNGAHPNLEVRVYRPTAGRLEGGHLGSIMYGLTNFKGANQRMHNKVLVADDAVAITGGRNVENKYFDASFGMNFKDRDVMVAGAVAVEMARTFIDFWDYRHTVPVEALRDVASADKEEPGEWLNSAVGRRLRALERQARDRAIVNRRLIRGMALAESVEFVSDLPGKNGALHLNGGGRATAHVIRALERAKEEIWIQSPYLVLQGSGMGYFKRLREAKPNLDIHVSTNSLGSTDNQVAYAGNVRSRDRYVHQLGLTIGEYQPWPADLRRVLPDYVWLMAQWRKGGTGSERPPFVCIHGKSFVVDHELAFVGSFNLDPRSAHLNTECGLLIRDARLAGMLKKEIQRDCQPRNCWWIAPRHENGGLIEIQMLSREVTDYSPVDMSVLDATSAFELRPGAQAVPRDHPDFYRNFRDIGSFPGGKGLLDKRELKGRLLKLSTPVMDPLL